MQVRSLCLFLADGRECKIVTGIGDHSRFCIIATVVARATARAVCSVFVTAMAEYGIPGEVLSDNGRQFTGRFGRPRPAQVLFERICRENGITRRLAKPRSPATTGKIERLHQMLQQELLNVHGPFASIEDAQVALGTWRKQDDVERPHQSLAMAYPAARFSPATGDVLGLRIPAELARPSSPAVPDADPAPDDPQAAGPPRDVDGDSPAGWAVELDRVVPPSGACGWQDSRSGRGRPRQAAPSGCTPGWTACACCWTGTGSRPCHPASMPGTWPAWLRAAPPRPGRRRRPRPVT